MLGTLVPMSRLVGGGWVGKHKVGGIEKVITKQKHLPSKKGISSSLALSGPRAAAMTVSFLQALTRNWTSSCLSWSISAATEERSSSSVWSTSDTSMALESGTGDLSSSIYSVGVIGVESTSICCIVLVLRVALTVDDVRNHALCKESSPQFRFAACLNQAQAKPSQSVTSQSALSFLQGMNEPLFNISPLTIIDSKHYEFLYPTAFAQGIVQ